MTASATRNVVPIACVICLAGCASFRPTPMGEVPFLERAQIQERDGIRVTVAVPDRGEAKRLFGLDLRRIQPVWLEIENGTQIPYLLFFSSLDPMYFSAREAAYKNHFRFRPATNARMDDHFDRLGIHPDVPPGGSTAGFVFTNRDEGTKHVYVGLFGPKRTQIFEFDVPVPGLRVDWHNVDWQSLYSEDEFVEFEDEEEFRAALRELPCCTTRENGTGEGDPLNLILVGDGDVVGSALTRGGWDETERLTWATGWTTFKSALFGREYRYSPMSSLYVYGRPQDAGFQKARDTIHERNHLRLWLAPMLFRGEPVWIGTITRDIGVYFTTRSWNLTTHAIDPDVDEARTYVAEDLLLSQRVQRFGYVEGIGAATQDEPHRNLMFAPWWTDGHRAVFLLDPDEPTSIEEIAFFYWDWPPEGDDSEFNAGLRALLEAD